MSKYRDVDEYVRNNMEKVERALFGDQFAEFIAAQRLLQDYIKMMSDDDRRKMRDEVEAIIKKRSAP